MTMITATLASALFAAVAGARRLVDALTSWRQSRRDYRVLYEMDDRTLGDLGLTRSDLRDATAVDYFDDPTLILAARAIERSGRPVAASPAIAAGPSIKAEACTRTAVATGTAIPCN
ncbi:DUF1127 domain-containing protein [Phreatobacter stygius]|nr:DUF1127 domain-containing protein [Phreatobacter stygius]